MLHRATEKYLCRSTKKTNVFPFKQYCQKSGEAAVSVLIQPSPQKVLECGDIFSFNREHVKSFCPVSHLKYGFLHNIFLSLPLSRYVSLPQSRFPHISTYCCLCLPMSLPSSLSILAAFFCHCVCPILLILHCYCYYLSHSILFVSSVTIVFCLHLSLRMLYSGF